MTSTPFAAWSLFLGYGLGVEGDLSLSSGDPGNFTPDGVLRGTRWGFSARSYPDLDFASLTPAIADEIRHRDFWTKIRGDELPGAIAFVLAEAAWGSGPGRAIMQMQTLCGVMADGAFGPDTMSALMVRVSKARGGETFIVTYQSQRLVYESSLDTWQINKLGWTRRMFGGTAVALGLDDAPAPAPPASAPAMLGAGRWLVTVEPA